MREEFAFERGNRDTFNDISRKAIPKNNDSVKKGVSEQRGSTTIRNKRPLMASTSTRV